MSTTINGYTFDETQWKRSGNGEWTHAVRGSDEYFLKRFPDPKRPSSRVSDKVRALKNKQCDDFSKERTDILRELQRCIGGNIKAPVQFFEHGGRFYQSTVWSSTPDWILAGLQHWMKQPRI